MSNILKWQKEKPVFKEDCILITVQMWSNRDPEYTLYEVKQTDGEDDDGNPAWYWGIFCCDGDEWGDIDDLTASMYAVIQPIK